jgi:hypothetical protein
MFCNKWSSELFMAKTVHTADFWVWHHLVLCAVLRNTMLPFSGSHSNPEDGHHVPVKCICLQNYSVTNQKHAIFKLTSIL